MKYPFNFVQFYFSVNLFSGTKTFLLDLKSKNKKL